MSISDDSEDEEEIKKRLFADLDQISVADQTERSFIMEPTNYVVQDYTQSKTWLDFLQQNRQRDQMLNEIEDDIQLMKRINQGNQVIEIEDDSGNIVQVQLQEQSNNEVIVQIKEQTQQPIILHDELIIQQVQQVQDERPKTTSKTTQKILKSNQEQKVQLMNQQREIMLMELEDNLSRESQEQWLKDLFKNRLFTLPERFPSIQPISIPTKVPEFNIPIFKMPQIIIPTIMDLSEENLAPSNTKELVYARLLNIKFHKLKYTEVELPLNQIVKQQTTTIIDSDLKYNIVYQDFLKNQSKLALSDSIEEIYWKKVNNLHQDLLSIVAKLKLPKYVSYRSPFTEYENPKTDIDNILTQEMHNSQFQLYIQSNQISKFTRKLEIKLENLTQLDGLQEMRELRRIILSSNQIADLTLFQSLTQLIEVDLQQNCIKQYDQLGRLPNLRILHLEMNQIQEMSKLANCNYLEIYSLKGNKIINMQHLDNLVFLKQLHLFKNQLKSISNLENCLLLEILDLSSNQIQIGLNENPFRNNQCLRKLILNKNKLQSLPEMRLLLLNELYLNKNKLESLDGIVYLPSLQILQASDNSLQTCFDTEYQVSYLPNVQQIDLSGNRIQSFGTIINFIQRCSDLKQINYLENPFLIGLSDEVLQLYRYMLILNCQQLIEVNQALLNKKDQQFLMEKFYGFLEPPPPKNKLDIERNFSKFTNQVITNTQLMHKINGLEQRKITKIHQFTYTERFKQIQVMNDFNFIKSNFTIQVDIDKEVQEFNKKFEKSLFKIQCLIIKWIYKFRKRKRYYSQKIHQIIIAQSVIRGHLARNQPTIKAFRQKHSKKKLHCYAVQIQKVWRGYIIRKRLKERMKRVKFEDSELDELGQFDDDFLKQDMDFNFDLRIPQGIDLQQIFKQTQSQQQLIQQQIHQQAQIKFSQKQESANSKKQEVTKKPLNNTETQMKTSHLTHSQMGSSKYSEKTAKTESLPTIGEKTKQIMQNWNFKDPAVAYTIACKLQKEQKRKNKAKELTAQEKLERFRQQANKH